MPTIPLPGQECLRSAAMMNYDIERTKIKFGERSFKMLSLVQQLGTLLGPSIKYVTLFLMIFDPPSPCHEQSKILDPPKSMSHF